MSFRMFSRSVPGIAMLMAVSLLESSGNPSKRTWEPSPNDVNWWLKLCGVVQRIGCWVSESLSEWSGSGKMLLLQVFNEHAAARQAGLKLGYLNLNWSTRILDGMLNDILGNIGNIWSISMMEPLCLHRFVGLWGQLPEIRFSDLRRGMTYAVMEWCKTQHDANVAAMFFSHFKSSLVCLIDFFIPESLPLGKFAAGSSSQWRIPLKWIERQGLSLWSSVIGKITDRSCRLIKLPGASFCGQRIPVPIRSVAGLAQGAHGGFGQMIFSTGKLENNFVGWRTYPYIWSNSILLHPYIHTYI